MNEHSARVKQIAADVQGFHDRKEQFRIYHGSTSTTRKTTLSRANVIDTSRLNHVVNLAVEKRTISVEPKVSMRQLVDTTLQHGLLPPVVMEFPEITVGGGFAGTSGESSSFRYGFFDNTVSKIEIVLADGEIVVASEKERPDLFNGAAGTFGTFGVITLLDIPLIDAKRFVKVTYSLSFTVEDTISCLEAEIKHNQSDYIEGILFSKTAGVIITGKLTDEQESGLPIVQYSRAKDPWFYLQAQTALKRKSQEKPYTELVPIRDYLFRYDRGAFWAGMYGFKYMGAPFTHFMRRLLNPLMHTATMYHALHKSHIADQYIVQDIGFPHSKLGAFLEYTDKNLKFYPLWLCPLKMQADLSLRPRNQAAYMEDSRFPGYMINVGIWGPGHVDYDTFVEMNREIERRTAELGGLKCFYAQAFYQEDEFWALYDKEWYDALRTKYKASALPSVYTKVNAALLQWKPKDQQTWRERLVVKSQRLRPFNGIYGTFHTFLKTNYLLKS